MLNIKKELQHITLFPLVDKNQNISQFILSLGQDENLPALEKLQKLSEHFMSQS